MSITKLFLGAGQSNMVSKNTSTGPSGNLPPYYKTGPGVQIFGYDSFAYPGNWTAGASEPWSDPTNAIDGGSHALRAVLDAFPSLGATSAMLPFLDNLRNAGDTSNKFAIPNALSQSYITDWLDSGGFATVPSYATLLGTMIARASCLKDTPNVKIGAFVFFCGESEANDPSTTPALAVAANLGAVFDLINTDVAALGIPWDKTHHFLLRQLPAGYGGAPLSWPQTATVRSQLATLAAGRSDVVLVQDPAPGTYIHNTKQDQLNLAAAMAPAWFAAA